MLPSRITEGENRNLKSPSWCSVFALVGLLTLTLTLHFVWLLYMNYNSQMNKEKGNLMVLVVF